MSAAKQSRTEAGASGGARVFSKIKEVRAYVPGTNQSGDDQGADCHDVEHEVCLPTGLSRLAFAKL